MKTSFHLVVNKKGAARVVKARPSLGFDEVSIAMNLELPDSLFQKPLLTASVTVPAKSVAPTVIDTQMVNNIQDAIKQSTGIEVKLTIDGGEQTR
jgi:hypothetical protein